MNNSPMLAEITRGICIRGTCANWQKKTWYHQVNVIGVGNARAARVYPPALATAASKGIRDQMQQDNQLPTAPVELSGSVPEHDIDYKTQRRGTISTMFAEAGLILTEFAKHAQRRCSG